ncbi:MULTISPECIES: GNAT family N-acetyltransferase [Halorussus]|uniref:GNAT family N-acetyltransferase n=1 Tax=Halorussus TaxID=1070314 RepID=UPI00209F34C0|nr:GNAT family N-acetyltransferase [Halorussus vallis]USZ74919.1 GNAT family N-acetyltransferase [Halorussus vallis]
MSTNADSDPELRRAETDDAERVRELVESSMTTSYALSPQDIETILDAEFAADDLRERFEDGDVIAFVAELDGVVAGYAQATVDGDEGEIRWLHVDPERRGAGVGTALFERLESELSDRGIEDPQAVALAANTEEGRFFERFDFAQVDERQTEIGDRDSVEYVYAEGGDAESESATDDDAQATEAGGTEVTFDVDELPDSVTTEDGQEVYLDEGLIAGSEGPFVQTFEDSDRSDKYGYYCANCGSTDVTMDNMERIKCGNCGNTHKPDEDYDASYL